MYLLSILVSEEQSKDGDIPAHVEHLLVLSQEPGGHLVQRTEQPTTKKKLRFEHQVSAKLDVWHGPPELHVLRELILELQHPIL